MKVDLDNIRQAEGIIDELYGVKQMIEDKINLSQIVGDEKRVTLNNNKIMRICLIIGLSLAAKRDMAKIREIQLSKTSNRIYANFFTTYNLRPMFEALLKLRYKDEKIDWADSPTVSRILALSLIHI